MAKNPYNCESENSNGKNWMKIMVIYLAQVNKIQGQIKAKNQIKLWLLTKFKYIKFKSNDC